MSHKSLLNQIILPLIILFTAMATGLFIIYCAITEQNSARVEQTLHQNLAEQIVHYSDELQRGEISKQVLQPAFHSLMLLGPSYEIYITDNQGKLLVFAAQASQIKRNSIDIKPLQAFIAGGSLPLYADNPRSLNQQKLFSAAPIYQSQQQVGYVFVILSGDKYDTIVENLPLDSGLYKILALLLLIFAIALAILIFIFARLVKPICQLDQDMTNFIASDFTNVSVTKPGPYTAIEINNLHLNFTSLQNKIHKQFSLIKSTEQLRRELLAHISHDLKTPLASLKGYLETWLLQYQDAAGADYIEIAQKNALQLERLVAQIIELAQLDSNTVSLYKEPIAVAELAQDVLNKFQLQAQKLNISLSVEPKDPSLQAFADIAKLERVLTNLVDNAIRHCQSGDSIQILLQPQGPQLVISIVDTGVGIPKDDVSHIFDAHFRAKNSINGHQGNSGLGLAIVAKLLSLHQARISVSSEQSHGTTFTFSLPSSIANS